MSKYKPTASELSAIADDLHHYQTDSIDQLELLVSVLGHLTERNHNANRKFDWNYEFSPSDLKTLGYALAKIGEDLTFTEGLESEEVLEACDEIRAMLAHKAMRAVGRA